MLLEHMFINSTSFSEDLEALPTDMCPTPTSQVITPFNSFYVHFTVGARFNVVFHSPEIKCLVVLVTECPAGHTRVVSMAVRTDEPKARGALKWWRVCCMRKPVNLGTIGRWAVMKLLCITQEITRKRSPHQGHLLFGCQECLDYMQGEERPTFSFISETTYWEGGGFLGGSE
jgi:hypothetical protein